MKKRNNCRVLGKSIPAWLVLTTLASAINTAYAADTVDLGTAGTQFDSGSTEASDPKTDPTAKGRAAAVAPTQTSLDATQPESIINKSFIEDTKSPVTDYTAAAAVAPGVSGGVSANGPGLGEAKNVLRGFQDGEYNVTYDGIPWGDTNGPTHHSTAYFPASVIGGVTVESGPGNASNMGQATFGGSVNITSNPLTSTQAVSPYFAYGSWNTRLEGATYNSGTIGQLGDVRYSVDVQDMASDGARKNMGVGAQNYNLKLEKPLGSSTLFTIFLNHHDNFYYQNDNDKGMTVANTAIYGKDYGLGTDPTKANYYGYNLTHKNTNFHYARLQSELGGGWAIDSNAYYYDYHNNTGSSSANTGSSPTAGESSVYLTTAHVATLGMPGYIKTNEYNIFGNIFKATKKFDDNLMRVGVWVEQAYTHRSRTDFDLLTGAANYDQTAVPGVYTTYNNVQYEQNSSWFQYQPFAEFEWAATKSLTITPGIKYMNTLLNVQALVNQSSRVPQTLTEDFTKTLPFLTANYKINPQWSAYAQYAQGMLVPDISYYQSSGASNTNIAPQTSTNYQLGLVHKSDRIATSGDIYYIDFANKIAQDPTSSSSNPVYYNQGAVVYKGIEGQITYALLNGYSLYANGSINHATSKDTGLEIAKAPETTTTLGVLYKKGALFGSLMYQRTGTQYALDGQLYKMGPQSAADFNIGYVIKHPGMGAKSLRVQLGVYNIFNNQDYLSVKPANSNGTTSASDLFQYQPERSFMTSAKLDF
ncbi:TonB-dependent receptor [Sulfuriferula nivalis]|nr:TonB-dependent receptor [Sulfuriferula nivalis]